jgi:putative Mg2+ transporter-C (MgtC) family protein
MAFHAGGFHQKALEKHFATAIAASLDLCRGEDARHLPGWCGTSGSDGGGSVETFWPELASLCSAGLAGGLIGLHRSIHGKPAGMRVHGLVAMTASLLTVLGTHLPSDGDLSRVVQGLITGIGFLGAGVILHRSTQDGSNHVYNLATATTMWMVAAIGVTFGMKLYGLGVSATITALVILTAFIWVDKTFYGRLSSREDIGDPVE